MVTRDPEPPPPPREHLEFYRVDQTRPTKRILGAAVLLLTVGPPLILIAAAPRSFPTPPGTGVLGAALMMAGLVVGFSGIALLMTDERYLAVVEGGLLVHWGKDEAFFAWDTLEAIRCEGDTLVLAVRGAGLDPAGAPRLSVPTPDMLRLRLSKEQLEVLAPRLEEWRRKASWNLAPLPPP